MEYAAVQYSMKFQFNRPWTTTLGVVALAFSLKPKPLLPRTESFIHFSRVVNAPTSRRMSTADIESTVSTPASVSRNDPATVDGKEFTQFRRSLRRKIPYVETFEDQATRELWETHEFDGTESVVDAVIRFSEEDPCGETGFAILTQLHTSPSPLLSTDASGYEDSFDKIYFQQNESSDTNVMDVGTFSSISKSMFAMVDDHEDSKQTKDKKQQFCLHVAYKGDDFCGWQTQLNNLEKPSVQRTLEEWLTELQNDDHPEGPSAVIDATKHAETKRNRRLEKQQKHQSNIEGKRRTTKVDKKEIPIKWADLPVAGRTDSGVSAIGQVCRFRTHRKELTAAAIQGHLTNRAQTTPSIADSLRVIHVEPVSKSYHPTFSTSCRAYVYLIDVDDNATHRDNVLLTIDRAEHQVALLDRMLRKVEGKELDFVGLSYGKIKTSTTMCTLHHARAKLVRYRSSSTANDSVERTAVCIELVGDRFLRRMVRLLVEASLRLVATEFSDSSNTTADESDTHSDPQDALLNLIQQKDRSIVGRPAPPNGLIFVGTRVSST